MVRALSWEEVEQIRRRFEALNPYGREVVPGSILKLEDVNTDPKTGSPRDLYCYAISAKRYTFYTLDKRGDPVVQPWGDEEKRTWKEHGLGHLLDPTDPRSEDRDWIRQCWQYIVSAAPDDEEPLFLDRPAIGRTTASTPHMLRPFRNYNRGKGYDEQVKPFNFLLVAHVVSFGLPSDGKTPMHLVAPFNSDASQWLKLRWTDLRSNSSYRITTTRESTETTIHVKSFRDVLREYQSHPEAKSSGPDNEPCARSTSGLLRRRSVQAMPFGPGLSAYIGKESNRQEEVEAGLVSQFGDVISAYEDLSRETWLRVWLPRAKRLSRQQITEITGMSRTQMTEMLAGRSVPRRATRVALARSLVLKF